MQKIKELLSRLQEPTFEARYPEYNPEDNKVHILYMSPYANGTGFYRFVIPSLHLNETATHAAIISNLQGWEGINGQKPTNFELDESGMKLIKWAHYIVFTMVSTDLRPIFLELLKINSKLRFYMDIDDNLHQLHTLHPLKNSFTSADKMNLVRNMSLCEFITSPNEKLLDFYEQRMHDLNPNVLTQLGHYHNNISPYLFDENYIKGNWTRPQFDKIRIGMIVNKVHFPNVHAFRRILLQVQEKYGDKIELLVMSWDGKCRGKNCFEDITFTHIPGAKFPEYFDAIKNMCLDFAIIPLRNDPAFNKYKSFQRYLEYACFAVPVIVGDSEVYTSVVQHEQTALVSLSNNQWIENISRMIEDAELRTRIGLAGYNLAWNKYSWTADGNTEKLTTLF